MFHNHLNTCDTPFGEPRWSNVSKMSSRFIKRTVLENFSAHKPDEPGTISTNGFKIVIKSPSPYASFVKKGACFDRGGNGIDIVARGLKILNNGVRDFVNQKIKHRGVKKIDFLREVRA